MGCYCTSISAPKMIAESNKMHGTSTMTKWHYLCAPQSERMRVYCICWGERVFWRCVNMYYARALFLDIFHHVVLFTTCTRWLHKHSANAIIEYVYILWIYYKHKYEGFLFLGRSAMLGRWIGRFTCTRCDTHATTLSSRNLLNSACNIGIARATLALDDRMIWLLINKPRAVYQ